MGYVNFPMILVLLGAILSASGAFLATYRQNQDKIQSANQRAEFERELRAKSDEIAKLSRQISDSVTGGDSFCYVDIEMAGQTNAPMLVLDHHGEFPLYDVSIRMWDPNDYRNVPDTMPFEQLTKNDLNFGIGNLSPHQARMLGRIQLPESDQKDFALSIGARNGFVMELIRLRRVNGIWKRAFKVYREKTDKTEAIVLLEWVEAGFPLDKNGKVQW